MIDFFIGLMSGGMIGTVFALFIAGESALKKEQEAYMEGFNDGRKSEGEVRNEADQKVIM